MHKYRGKRLDGGIITITDVIGKKAKYKCDCGSVKEAWLYDIEKGKIRSCGCLRHKKLLQRNTKHGYSKSNRLYRIWRGIKARCYIKSATSFDNYGGRGIAVSDEWRFDFKAFREWALSNGYDDTLTIERNDVNGNYEASNCSWIPKSEQSKNRRTKSVCPDRDRYGRFIKNECNIHDNPALLTTKTTNNGNK